MFFSCLDLCCCQSAQEVARCQGMPSKILLGLCCVTLGLDSMALKTWLEYTSCGFLFLFGIKALNV